EDLLDHAFPSGGAAPPHRAAIILETAHDSAHPGDPPLDAAPPAALARASYVEGVVWLGAQLADALAFLPSRKVYHRDLKPSNVLIGLDGRARLLDFNLAADVSTSPARLGGTLPFMAPEHIGASLASGEQADKAPPPDGRADLFSLGVVLYELLTGSH